jgi:hypothetical protein
VKGADYVICLPTERYVNIPADEMYDSLGNWLISGFDVLMGFIGHKRIVGPGGEELSEWTIANSPAMFVWAVMVLYLLNHISNKRTGTTVYQTDLEPLLAELKEIKKELRAQSEDEPVDG